MRLQAAGAGLGAIGACTEGMHGLKPYPALAVAISELPTTIAFALSNLIFLLCGGSEWEWMGHVEPFCVTCDRRVTQRLLAGVATCRLTLRSRNTSRLV